VVPTVTWFTTLGSFDIGLLLCPYSPTSRSRVLAAGRMSWSRRRLATSKTPSSVFYQNFSMQMIEFVQDGFTRRLFGNMFQVSWCLALIALLSGFASPSRSKGGLPFTDTSLSRVSKLFSPF
jgi:hypothetical protein